MKPRDILNRGKRIYLTVAAASFAVMVILAFLERHLPPSLSRAMTVVAVAVFAVAVISVYVGIRCPKCKAILGLAFVFSEETLDKCPRCGINFDDDL